MPNFSSLGGLEVPEKLVVVVGWVVGFDNNAFSGLGVIRGLF